MDGADFVVKSGMPVCGLAPPGCPQAQCSHLHVPTLTLMARCMCTARQRQEVAYLADAVGVREAACGGVGVLAAALRGHVGLVAFAPAHGEDALDRAAGVLQQVGDRLAAAGHEVLHALALRRDVLVDVAAASVD